MEPNFWPSNTFDHLKVPPDGTCWWCRSAPADSAEHKFKRSDLTAELNDGALFWGSGGSAPLYEIRGKSGVRRDRYGVIKFEKSMCRKCNGARSQPFDRAYDRFSAAVRGRQSTHHTELRLDEIYGESWRDESLNLARYYAKHFGCRMVRAGFPIPTSIREFLDGGEDMSDGHMAVVWIDSLRRDKRKILGISADFAQSDEDISRFTRFVLAAYVGCIGVRYVWNLDGIPNGLRTQFFHQPRPAIHYFQNENSMACWREHKSPLRARIRHRLRNQ